MDLDRSHYDQGSTSTGSRTTTVDRLLLYQHQLQASSSSTTQQPPPAPEKTTKPMAQRDPITCHVLNTLTGTPAAGLDVTLTLLDHDNAEEFTATTNADGRVGQWTGGKETVGAKLLPRGGKTDWSVRFNVGPWYEAQGVESFWPEIEVKFSVKGREGEPGWRHYHVPVLLGPWNYSTYRGS